MLLYLAVIFIFAAILLTISSQVRKAARAAFESETVDAGEFTITKPEGFISPLNDDSVFAFEAYSKDFGAAGDAENLRQAQAYIKVFPNGNFTGACEQAKNGAGKILSEEASGETCLIKTEETLEKASAYNFYKIIADEKRDRIYELKITVLQDSMEDYQTRIDEMLESFRVK